MPRLGYIPCDDQNKLFPSANPKPKTIPKTCISYAQQTPCDGNWRQYATAACVVGHRIKTVDIVDTSYVKEILGTKALSVNSWHNQAVDGVVERLNACAHDRDGFIQAIDSNKHQQHIVGVPWHPEYLPDPSTHRKLFTTFSKQVNASTKTLACNKLPEFN